MPPSTTRQQIFEEKLAGFPPLLLIIEALNEVNKVTADFANLTTAVLQYGALNATFDAWQPEVVVASLHRIAESAAVLQARSPPAPRALPACAPRPAAGPHARQDGALRADAPQDARLGELLPELTLLAVSLDTLPCVDSLLQTLSVINASLLRLPPQSQRLHDQGAALRVALRALPEVDHFTAAVKMVQANLAVLPGTPAYVEAVGRVDAALRALPAGAPLVAAMQAVQDVIALPHDHGWLVNSTGHLLEAISALPASAPLLASLGTFNRSRDVLPPLIERALASIAYYDETGDDSDMTALHLATAELEQLLAQAASSDLARPRRTSPEPASISEREPPPLPPPPIPFPVRAQVEAHPDDSALRESLALIEVRLAAVPPTQPHAEQLLALRAAIDTLPPLPPRAALFDALYAAYPPSSTTTPLLPPPSSTAAALLHRRLLCLHHLLLLHGHPHRLPHRQHGPHRAGTTRRSPRPPSRRCATAGRTSTAPCSSCPTCPARGRRWSTTSACRRRSLRRPRR